MDRRHFLKSGVATAAATAVLADLSTVPARADEAKTAGAAGGSEVVAVRNGSAAAMFRKGIEALGGMTAFVKPGQKVVVKPNIGWDRTPEQAANTNPDLVAEIVRQAMAAGAAQVQVFDHTCNEWKSCYRNSGIEAAVVAAGGKMLSAHDEKLHYVEKRCPQAVSMKTAKIHQAIIDADVFINVPVLKHHGGAKMTAAMKNYLGIFWDRSFMHKNNLPQCIADCALYRRPDLNVVDAYRIVVANGPRGKVAEDIREMRYQLLSRDIVAIDAMATKVIGYELADVPYIALAATAGLGVADFSRITVKRLEA